jgi:tetratricopeptide (TPR) repeat protein
MRHSLDTLRRGGPCALALLLAVAVAGCGSEPPPDYLSEARRLYDEQQYDEAVRFWKRHLLWHPDDAAAHFYLGVSLLRAPYNFHLPTAQGEFETALALFRRQGRANPIPEFSSAQYFELRCIVEISKVSFKQLQMLMRRTEGDPLLQYWDDIIATARRYLDEGDEVFPGHPDVVNLRNLLDDLERAGPRRSPAPGQRPRVGPVGT